MDRSDGKSGVGSGDESGAATILLARVSNGDSSASSELLPLVYDQLRAIAGGQFRGQRFNHTLQPTALVHEAYLKLIGSGSDWKDHAHFCALAATAMRQILINHARAKSAAKRDADPSTITIGEIETPSGTSPLDLIALDEALTQLQDFNERYARLVELRFFGGLGIKEIASILESSEPTIRKEWRRVKAWLLRELDNEQAGPAS